MTSSVSWGARRQHGLDAGHQLLGREGLGDVVVGAGFQAVDLVLLGALGGEHDDRNGAGAFVVAQLARDGQAGSAGQHPVQQDQVGQLGADQGLGLVGVEGAQHLCPAKDRLTAISSWMAGSSSTTRMVLDMVAVWARCGAPARREHCDSMAAIFQVCDRSAIVWRVAGRLRASDRLPLGDISGIHHANPSESQHSADSASQSTHFGFQTVPEGDKARKVAEVFHSVAQRYDIMNDFMSAGLHRVWKAFTIGRAAIRPGMKVLDIAGGTATWRAPSPSAPVRTGKSG